MNVLLPFSAPFTNVFQSLNRGDPQTLKDAHSPGTVSSQEEASLYLPLKLMLKKRTSTAEASPAWMGRIKLPLTEETRQKYIMDYKEKKKIKSYFNGLLVDESHQTLFN